MVLLGLSLLEREGSGIYWGSDGGQRDLGGLEKMADRHLVKFKGDKCYVLHLRQNNTVPQGQQELNGQGVALGERTWGSWGQPGSPHVSSTTPTDHIWGCTGRGTTGSAKDGVLLLCLALETRPSSGSSLGFPGTTH